MYSRTEAGVVVAIKGSRLTIRLRAGNKKSVHVKDTNLTIGSKCQCCFDNSTEKIVELLDYDEHASFANMTPTERGGFPTIAEIKLLAKDEERGGTKPKRYTCWESEELELWSKECSQSTEE
jgi:hypothetical protein